MVGKNFRTAIATDAYAVAETSGRLHDFGIIEDIADLPDVSSCLSERRRSPRYFAWGCFQYFGELTLEGGSPTSPVVAAKGTSSAKASERLRGL